MVVAKKFCGAPLRPEVLSCVKSPPTVSVPRTSSPLCERLLSITKLPATVTASPVSSISRVPVLEA